jgi:hypothetical protein
MNSCRYTEAYADYERETLVKEVAALKTLVASLEVGLHTLRPVVPASAGAEADQTTRTEAEEATREAREGLGYAALEAERRLPCHGQSPHLPQPIARKRATVSNP